MVALSEQSALLYRAPLLVAAAQTRAELVDTLESTLRGLYRSIRRHALYLSDDRDDLVAVAEQPESLFPNAPSLLDSLRARLPAERERRALARARRFPSLGGGSEALLSAPLLDSGRLAGLIVIEATSSCNFTPSDLEVLKGIAALFSLALQRLRSGAAGPSRQDAERDRRDASRVQRLLLGRSLRADTGVTVDARYLPALDVGGDFYEVTDLGDGQVGGAIGDVSGKGVAAALIMSRVSSDVRRALKSGVGPSTVLREVNSTLTDVESEVFVTASCFRLDVNLRKLTVANAGHIPVFVRRAGGDVFTFGPSSGTPLGMMPCEYADEEIDLAPLDIVLLVTDGLMEAFDRPRDRLGVERVLRILKHAPPDPKIVNARLLQAVNRAKRSRPLDDLTLVALRLEHR